MTAPEPAVEIEHEQISQAKYAETLAAVGFLAEIDPATVKGYVLVIDNGSSEAQVCTDMDLPNCGALLYRTLEILIGGAR